MAQFFRGNYGVNSNIIHMKKIICKIFGHKLRIGKAVIWGINKKPVLLRAAPIYCKRCGQECKSKWDKNTVRKINIDAHNNQMSVSFTPSKEEIKK